MEDRRTFLALAAALLPIGLDAQTAPPPPGAPVRFLAFLVVPKGSPVVVVGA